MLAAVHNLQSDPTPQLWSGDVVWIPPGTETNLLGDELLNVLTDELGNPISLPAGN